MTELPNCPLCASNFTWLDQTLFNCPECGHIWSENDLSDHNETESFIVKDANGNQLQENDHVTLIKDLKVKGSSSTLKIGTKIKILRLVDNDHNIDCKIDGFGQMALKSEFVKKNS